MVFFLPLAGAVVHLGFSFGFQPKKARVGTGSTQLTVYVLCVR
jgi:hypothetical protein